MKKIVLLVICLFPIMVFGMEYSDKSINLTLDVDDYVVITRDNISNNSDLKELGITEDDMTNIMNKNSIYFDIISNDLSHEILVIIPNVKVQINNLSNVPSKFLNELSDKLAKEVGLEKAEIYRNKYVYIVRDYYDSKTGYNIINYYTIVNAKGYNFQIQKRDSITDDERSSLKKIIDSANITILDEYRNEDPKVIDALNGNSKSGIDWQYIVIRAVIGGIIGGLCALITNFIKKRKR